MKYKDSILNWISYIIISLLFFIYIIVFSSIYNNQFDIFDTNIMWILCAMGCIEYIFIIYTYYKNTKKIYSLYTIFITIMIIFNYGQCLLWTFGIHRNYEIGKKIFYGKYFFDIKDIILAQLITLIGILMFHLGALINITLMNKNRKIKNTNYEVEKNRKSIIFITSIILSFICIPIAFYTLITNISVAKISGYGGVGYGITKFGLLGALANKLFYPCLFGLLIGSDFKKNIRNIVYLIFFSYIVLALLSGDRGEWFYALLIFIFLHHNYVKKITFKKLIPMVAICYFGLVLIKAVVSVRTGAFSITSILGNINVKSNPVFDFIFEMGSTMNIQTILIKEGWNIYPFGNTYFLSLLGIVSDKLIYFIGIKYINLSVWFSQYYLKISWGAAFSIIAESLLNFGPYFSPIAMMILGFIISKLIYYDKKEDMVLNKMFSLISCNSLIYISRNGLSYYLKYSFFCIVVFFFMYYIVYKCYKKNGRDNNYENTICNYDTK